MDNTQRRQIVKADLKLKKLWRIAIILQSIPILASIIGIPFLAFVAVIFVLLEAVLILLVVGVNKWATFFFPIVILALFFLCLITLVMLAWGDTPLWLWLCIVVLLLPSVVCFFILRRIDSLLARKTKISVSGTSI